MLFDTLWNTLPVYSLSWHAMRLSAGALNVYHSCVAEARETIKGKNRDE
jgi:hypothetical protein